MADGGARKPGLAEVIPIGKGGARPPEDRPEAPAEDPNPPPVRRVQFFYPALFVAIFLLAAALVFPLLFYVAGYRDAVVELIESKTGRDVTIRDARLDFGGGVGFLLDGVRVQDPASGHTVLEADSIVVNVGLRALLQRRLEVIAVTLSRPEVRLVRDETGALDLADLLPEGASLAPVPGEGEGGWIRRVVEKLREAPPRTEVLVTEGRVVLEDRRVGERYALEGLRAAVSHAVLGGHLDFMLSTRVARGSDVAAVHVTGKLGPLGADSPVPDLSAELRVEDVDLGAALKGRIPETSTVRGRAGALVRLELPDGDTLRAEGVVRVSEPYFADPTYFSSALAGHELKVNFSADLTDRDLEVHQHEIRFDRLSASGRVVVRGIDTDDPYVEIHTKTPFVPIPDAARMIPAPYIDRALWYFLTERAQGGEGRVARSAIRGRLSQIRAFDAPENAEVVEARFEFRDGVMTLPDGFHTATGVYGAIDWSKGDLAFTDWVGRYGPHEIVRAGGRIDKIYAPTSILDFQVTGDVDFADAVSQLSLSYFPEPVRRAARAVRDPRGRGEVTVRPYSAFTVDRFDLETSGTARFANLTARVEGYPWRIKAVDGTAYFDERQLGTKGMTLEVGGDRVHLSGSIREYTRPDPVAELSVRSPLIDVAKLLALRLDDRSVEASGIASGSFHFRAGGKAKPVLSAAAHLRDVRITKPALFEDFGAMTGHLGVAPSGELTVRDLHTTFVGHPAVFNGTVTSYDPIRASLSVRAPWLDLDRLFERFWPDLPSDGATAPKRRPVDPKGLEGVELRGYLESDLMDMGDVEFQNFSSSFLVEDGDLQVDDFKFASLEGKFAGSGRFRHFFDEANRTLEFRAQCEGLDVEELSHALAIDNEIVTGRISTVARMRGRAGDWDAFRGSVDGALSFSMSGGEIHGLPVLSRILDLLGLNMAGFSTKQMEYEAIDADFKFEQGVGRTDNFLVNSRTMKIRAAGEVVLPVESVDMVVEVQPLERLDRIVGGIPVVGTILTGPDRNRKVLAVYYRVEGPWDDPQVEQTSIESLATLWRPAGDWLIRLLGRERGG